MENNKISTNSSLLVSPTALILWAVLAAAAAAAGYIPLAGLFVFFLLFFSFLRHWSTRAMHGLSIEIKCSRLCLFPGMETEIEYKIKNDKLLPLAWLELSQQAPEKEIILPDDSFEAYSYLKNDEDKVWKIDAFRRNFSLVMGYESMTLSSTWHAKGRGIYCPKELLLRSGDGFGLSQVEKNYPAALLPEIVVYPKRVPVDGELFLQRDWEKNCGAVGFKEDMSVLRGLRPYSSTDSWKRINWRMAARQTGELNVNFYETVQPASAVFILDGESYCEKPEALEQDLELISSMVELLSSKGINCGLCLPASKNFPALNFSPEQQCTASELMYYLAGYDCLEKPVLDKEGRPTGRYYPSSYDLAALAQASMEAGTVALFTYAPSALSTRLLERLERSRLMVFSSAPDECRTKELDLHHSSMLKKGGGA